MMRSISLCRVAASLPLLTVLALGGCDDPVIPDTTAPTVTISAPAASSFAPAEVTVEGTASDDKQVTSLTYTLNGGAAQNVSITPGASVSFRFAVPGLTEGENTIVVRAVDAAGNERTAQVMVLHDIRAPVVETASATVTGAEARVQGRATDGRGVTRMTYQLNGGAEQPVTITTGTTVNFDFTVPNLPVGQHTIQVNAFDAAGNRGQRQVSVTRAPPPTAPVISNLTVTLVAVNSANCPADANGNRGSQYRYTFSFTDVNGDVTASGTPVTLTSVFQPSGQTLSGNFPVTMTGTGSSGTMTISVCTTFGNATSSTDTFTLRDSAGLVSNALTTTRTKPAGANSLSPTMMSEVAPEGR